MVRAPANPLIEHRQRSSLLLAENPRSLMLNGIFGAEKAINLLLLIGPDSFSLELITV